MTWGSHSVPGCHDPSPHVHHVQWNKWSGFTDRKKKWDLTGDSVWTEDEGSSWSGRICFMGPGPGHFTTLLVNMAHLENIADSIDDCSPSHRPGAQQSFRVAKWPRSIKIQPWKRLDIKWKTEMHVQCYITVPLGSKMILQRLNGKEAQTSMNRR